MVSGASRGWGEAQQPLYCLADNSSRMGAGGYSLAGSCRGSIGSNYAH